MTLRTLFDRLLDDRPATQEADTWRGIQARIERPRSRRWILVAAGLSIALGIFWLRTPAEEPDAGMYLFIVRTDVPSSQALELTLKESP